MAERVEILRRCGTYEQMPDAFSETWAEPERKTVKRIAKARKALAQVDVPDTVLADAADLCLAVGADGLRGELTLVRAARAAAALEGKRKVHHLKAVAPMALRHRLRRNVLDETGSSTRIERAIAELWP